MKDSCCAQGSSPVLFGVLKTRTAFEGGIPNCYYGVRNINCVNRSGESAGLPVGDVNQELLDKLFGAFLNVLPALYFGFVPSQL